MLVKGPPPQSQARYLTCQTQSSLGGFFLFHSIISPGPCPAFIVCPADIPPGLTRSPSGESLQWGQESLSTSLSGARGRGGGRGSVHLCPSPEPGPSSTSPGLGGQQTDCRGLRPTHLLNSSQPTLQQDSQEGDSGQKSHLFLHGAGGSVRLAGV